MQEGIVIQAKKRTILGKQVRALRRSGLLPAVLYGKHIDNPISLSLEAVEANRLLTRLSTSHLITIEIDDEKHIALLRDKQRDYIRGHLTHVDFLAVSMSEKLRTQVRIELVGHAPAVTDLGGMLVTGVTELEIECLPGDLPEIIQVDVSVLTRIGSSLQIKDIVMPERVTLLSNPTEMIVQAISPMGEEIAILEGGTIEPEVVEKGKKEKEEAA